MRAKAALGVCASIVLATIICGIKVEIEAAEERQWQVKLAPPGEDYRPVGQTFSTRVDCDLAVEKEARKAPSGSLILCAIERK